MPEVFFCSKAAIVSGEAVIEILAREKSALDAAVTVLFSLARISIAA